MNNVFRLLIAAVVALTLLYFIYTLFVPLVTPETKIGALTDGLLLEAQSDLGHAKGTTLTLKAGQTLYARNLDSSTRTVAFQCSTPDCCAYIDKCTQPLSVTGDRIVVNQPVKSTITARCEEVNQIHACKVYVGKDPAQLILENVMVSTTITLSSTPQELPVHVSVRNTGENPAGNVTVRAEWLEDQTLAGASVPTLLKSDEKTIDSLAASKNQNVDLGIVTDTLGTYTLRVLVSGEDAGSEEKTFTVVVNGTEASLCARDKTKSEAAFFDSFDQMCRKKVFCSGCDFTYECRQIWEKEAPITGGVGTGYDQERGEPGFTYQVWTSDNGSCT